MIRQVSCEVMVSKDPSLKLNDFILISMHYQSKCYLRLFFSNTYFFMVILFLVVMTILTGDQIVSLSEENRISIKPVTSLGTLN